MKLVFGRAEELARWVSDRIPPGGWHFDKYRAIGVEDDGQIIAAVVYSNYRARCGSIELSIAADNPRWARRGIIGALLAYPFEQLSVRRCTVTVAASNIRCQRMVEGLGWVQEGTMRQAWPTGEDAILYGMLRAECRWLSTPKEHIIMPNEDTKQRDIEAADRAERSRRASEGLPVEKPKERTARHALGVPHKETDEEERARRQAQYEAQTRSAGQAPKPTAKEIENARKGQEARGEAVSVPSPPMTRAEEAAEVERRRMANAPEPGVVHTDEQHRQAELADANKAASATGSLSPEEGRSRDAELRKQQDADHRSRTTNPVDVERHNRDQVDAQRSAGDAAARAQDPTGRPLTDDERARRTAAAQRAQAGGHPQKSAAELAAEAGSKPDGDRVTPHIPRDGSPDKPQKGR